MTIQFIVSCNHKVDRYRLDNELVTVKEDRFDHRWWWNHPMYGCSKSYQTPTDAIVGMLCDHACFNIQIKEPSP